MECKACGSQNGEARSGISKKTGKPWSGWKCFDCDEMSFTNSKSSGGQQQSQTYNKIAPKIAVKGSNKDDLTMYTAFSKDIMNKLLDLFKDDKQKVGDMHDFCIAKVADGGLYLKTGGKHPSEDEIQF